MTERLQKSLRIIAGCAQSMIVILLAIGFVMQAGGAQALIANYTKSNSGEDCSVIPLLNSCEYSESDPVTMTPSGRPAASEHAFVACQVTSQNGDSSNRIKPSSNKLCVVSPDNSEIDSKSSLINSSSLVSSRLGRQFRLVGAKPSGTG